MRRMTGKVRKIAAAAAAVTAGFGLALAAYGAAAGGSRFISDADMSGVTREDVGALLNENYYAYINFEDLQNDVIPYGESYLAKGDWTLDALTGMLRDTAENRGSFARGTNEQKIADFYVQLYDEEARESAGISALTEIMDKIDGAADINEFVEVCAELQWEYGIATILAPRFYVGIFDSSRGSIMHTQMKLPVESDDFFKKYGTAEGLQRTVRGIIESRGGEDAPARAEKCVDMLIEIAENSIPEDELFDHISEYSEITLDKLDGLFGADMSPYTEGLSPYCSVITVCDMGQLECEGKLLCADNLRAWKDYALTEVLADVADYLPESVIPLVMPLGKSYIKPMDDAVARLFENELAYMFSEKYANEELMESAREFTEEIIAAYGKMIRGSSSIDDATKERFLKKLENMCISIDVPHEPYDGHYDCVPAEEGGSFLRNILNRKAGQFIGMLENAGKPYDKTAYDWDGMPPQTFSNAQYHVANYVTIPYATLSKPFYDKDRDKYENLGRLGYIICHEISHGFDSSGIQFNEYGNLDPGWIGEEYAAVLEQKKADITELYGGYKLFGAYPLDGKLTLGENMADIAAMQCLLSMAKTPEQTKTVLESAARGWYQLVYDSAAYDQLYHDEHSLPEFRSNIVISQMDEYYEVYGVTDGKMYTPPENRRRVW